METEGDEVTSRQLRRLEKDLLLIQRTRSELTSKLRKILEKLDATSVICTTLKLLIMDTREKIEIQAGAEKAEKKKPVRNYCRSGVS